MESKKTPFYDKHVLNHAKMVDFAGYRMPMLYKGIVPEHQQVRKSVGMFDISHMGEFRIRGEGAKDFIQKMITNDVSKLDRHKILYSVMCYDDGGIVDDLLVYNLGGNEWMLVVNASNVVKDFQWLKDHKPDDVELENVSDETALLAIQGPYAENVVQKMTKFNLSTLPYYNSTELDFGGAKVLISRTGYTGEDGFEIYHNPANSSMFWDKFLEYGEPMNIMPIGLGARDSLRLEMKFALYGNDIDETTHPLEAGLKWVVKFNKGDFIGRDELLRIKENDAFNRRLVCIEAQERCFPRKGHKIIINGQEMGEVTSGLFSPTLNKGIAIAYVQRPHTKRGTEVGISIRNRIISAEVVKPPFYKDGSLKSGK
ncbi:MAG: glycine cleavage system aminomethyltransferase GcvT [Candidatus Zixiibacteriota bacterium]